MRILLVEDDKKLSNLIKEYLLNHGYTINIEHHGDKAVYRIQHENYDLIILDINLPGLNGLQICQMVRKTFSGQIFILTANKEDEDHVMGLKLGADDYMSKPISPKVLLARIQALTRRKTSSSLASKLIFGKLTIDLAAREVKLDQAVIDLKPTEFDLLALLATNAGISLSRDTIMLALRGIEYDGVDRSIDLRISYLRTKLQDDITSPFRIKTIRGKGYVFQPDAWD